MESAEPTTEAPPEEKKKRRGLLVGMDQHAQRMLALSSVGALVVGLLGGFAIGFKVEHDRVQKKAKPKVAAAAKNNTAKSRTINRLSGTVGAVEAGTVTVNDTSGFHVKVATPASVAIEQSKRGSISDIKPGSTILLRLNGARKGVNDASAIIVLPTLNKFGGRKVAAVDPNKITVAQGKNKPPLTVTVTPTTVITTVTPTTASKITKGSGVVVAGNGFLGHDTFTAKELLILPAASPFTTS